MYFLILEGLYFAIVLVQYTTSNRLPHQYTNHISLQLVYNFFERSLQLKGKAGRPYWGSRDESPLLLSPLASRRLIRRPPKESSGLVWPAVRCERGRIEFCRIGQPLAPWERYGLPAKIPLLRILMLYLLTSPHALEQVCVPSAQTFVGTASFPQMVQSRLFSRESLVRRAENRSGLV